MDAWHCCDAINTAGIDVHKQMPLKNYFMKNSILWAQTYLLQLGRADLRA